MRPLFLVGMMGSGKTAIGSQLARLFNVPFYDLDLLIEQASGKTISQIFEESGEQAFRDLETDRLRWVLRQSAGVVATGGGTAIREENRSLMRQNGWIAYLMASPETLLSRVGTNSQRPLLKVPNPLHRLHELLKERETFYLESDWQIETDLLSEQVLVQQLRSIFSPQRHNPHQIHVVLGGEHDYEIEIAPGLLTAAERLLPYLSSPQSVILTHPLLIPYAETLKTGLQKAGVQVSCITIAPGERHKNLLRAKTLYHELVRLKTDRKTSLIALGGGVIGDLGGFVASTYMRGIPFIQIPTTLLAQVDSSVGGKTGVDLPDGKNLVGTFYQPQYVLIDPNTLLSLPGRQWRNGMAEILKYGITLDTGLWKRLQIQQGIRPSRRNPERVMDWLPVIGKCVQLKAKLVQEDEKDLIGRRAVLNFGHTVGHAVESVLGYHSWLHGEAVAAGMVVEAEIGRRLGITPSSAVEELMNALQHYGLPVRLPALPADDLLQTMQKDKKTMGGQLNMVLLSAVGQAELVSNVPSVLVKEVLCAYSA
jgi:shikimate kinase/3-dehydroquinate synthase